MDRTLLALFSLSALLVSFVAPLATMMVATILSATALVIWGSWSLLRDAGYPQPEVTQAMHRE